jgi:hypothetical protein
MQVNGLRGLLTEYGEVMGKGRAALDKAMPGVIETLARGWSRSASAGHRMW